jgi:hypothetical protein
MRLRRGCSCPILILVVADMFFVVGSIISLIRGPSSEPTQATRLGSVLSLIVMGANLIVCAVLAIVALRSQADGPSTAETPYEKDSPEEWSAGDSGQDDENV